MGCSSFTRAWTFSDFRGLNEAGREFIDTGFPRTVRVPVADPSAAKTPSGRRLRSKIVMSWKRTYPVRRTLRSSTLKKPKQRGAVSLPGRCRNHVVSAKISTGSPCRALPLCFQAVSMNITEEALPWMMSGVVVPDLESRSLVLPSLPPQLFEHNSSVNQH